MKSVAAAIADLRDAGSDVTPATTTTTPGEGVAPWAPRGVGWGGGAPAAPLDERASEAPPPQPPPTAIPPPIPPRISGCRIEERGSGRPMRSVL